MGIFRKDGGSWSTVNSVYRKVSGSWTNVATVFRKVSGAWTIVFNGGGAPAIQDRKSTRLNSSH